MESNKSKRWQIVLSILMLLETALFLVLVLVIAPKTLGPLFEVPPNRFFSPPLPIGIARFITILGSEYWIIALLLAGFFQILIWRKGDKFLKPAVIVTALVLLGTGTLACYVMLIPSWVEREYGRGVREKLYHK